MIDFFYEVESVRPISGRDLPDGLLMVERWTDQRLSNALWHHRNHRGRASTREPTGSCDDLRLCLLAQAGSRPGAAGATAPRLVRAKGYQVARSVKEIGSGLNIPAQIPGVAVRPEHHHHRHRA